SQTVLGNALLDAPNSGATRYCFAVAMRRNFEPIMKMIRDRMVLMALGILVLSGCVQVPSWEALNRLNSDHSLGAAKPHRQRSDINGTVITDPLITRVATVVSPETDPRSISLAECLALAL